MSGIMESAGVAYSTAAAIERKRIEDYRLTFSSEHGQRVLEDLKDRFLLQSSSAHVCAGNTSGVLYIDGQRMLVRYIIRQLSMDIDAHLSMFYKSEGQPSDPLGDMNAGGYI